MSCLRLCHCWRIKIDRVDSSIGYVESNCVACCAQCNIAKSDYTKDEFVAMARRIVSKWGAHA